MAQPPPNGIVAADPVVADASGLVKGELIGREVRVASTRDPTLTGVAGLVVDETLGTLIIDTDPDGSAAGANGRRVTVPKVGQSFAFDQDGQVLLVEGSAIAYRPEDRIKKARV